MGVSFIYMWEIWVQSLVWDDPLEKGMATHSSILAWRIPWTEETGGLQSLGSQRDGHDWVNFTSLGGIISFHSAVLSGDTDSKKEFQVLKEYYLAKYTRICPPNKNHLRNSLAFLKLPLQGSFPPEVGQG